MEDIVERFRILSSEIISGNKRIILLIAFREILYDKFMNKVVSKLYRDELMQVYECNKLKFFLRLVVKCASSMSDESKAIHTAYSVIALVADISKT